MQQLKALFTNKSVKELIIVGGLSLLTRLAIITLIVIFSHAGGNISERVGTSLSHWDSGWYLKIAEHGYDNTYPELPPDHLLCNSGTGYCQRNFAFFPAYPVLLRTTSDLTGLSLNVSGVVISNLAFVLTAVVLYRFALELFGQKTAKYSLLALWLWPAGYIFSGVMTESLFMLLLISICYLVFRKKYLAAGILGALITATRNTGILVLVPMVLLYLYNNRDINLRNWRKTDKKFLLGLVLVPIGLVAFMLYLQNRIGDPLAFISIQKYWQKPVLDLNPLFGIYFAIFDHRVENSIIFHIYDLVYFFGTVFLFWYAVAKKAMPFSLSVILSFLLVPVSAGTLLALSRYTAVLFPVYLLLGRLGAKHQRLAIPVYGFCLLLMVFLAYFYSREHWITV